MTLKRIGWYGVLVVIYLLSTVPVGLLLYSAKSYLGINVIEHGGFHTFARCIGEQMPKNFVF